MDKSFWYTYELLGQFLENLKNAPEIGSSPELLRRMEKTFQIYQWLERDFSGLVRGYELLSQELITAQADTPSEKLFTEINGVRLF